MILALLAATGCGLGRAPAPSAPGPPLTQPSVVAIAYIGPAGTPHRGPAVAFALALREASSAPQGSVRVVERRFDAACNAADLQRAALAAGADPAVGAAALYDCGSADGAALRMLRTLQLPAVLWGRGLRAALPTASTQATNAPAAGLGAAVAAFDAARGLRAVACLDDGLAADTAQCAQLATAAAAAGLTVPLQASLPPTALAAAPRGPAAGVLGRLAAARPDAVWYAGGASAAARLLAALRAAGAGAVLEGGQALVSPAFSAAAGTAGQGTVGFVPGVARGGAAALQAFDAAYAAAGLRGRPGPQEQQAFAAATVLADVIRQAGTHRAAIASRLGRGVAALPTVLGPVTFDAAGRDVARTWVPYALQGGTWAPWSPAVVIRPLPLPPAPAPPASAPPTVSGSTYGG